MKITKKEAGLVKKHGINLWVYKTNREEAGMVYVEVEEGHFQEFYDKKSTFFYYILQGRGTFYLDGKPTPVKATDFIVAPPLTKIYYFGKMKMVLMTVPGWKPENEVHVRFIARAKQRKVKKR